MASPALVDFEEGVGLARAALRSIPLDALSANELSAVVVDARRCVAALQASVSQLAVRAEQRRAFATRGASTADAFLAGAGRQSVAGTRAELAVGRAMEASDDIAQAVAAGAVSRDNARLLGAVVEHPRFKSEAAYLVRLAEQLPPNLLRSELAAWASLTDPDGETQREQAKRQRRYLNLTALPDGMTRLDGLLTAADAEQVRSSLHHLVQQQWNDGTGREPGQRRADSLVDLCFAYAAGTVTGGRERPHAIVSVDWATLTSRTGRARVDGRSISAEEARQLCCDAGISRVVTRGRSQPLDVGMTQRTVTAAQWAAMLARDGGCVWPGCDRPIDWCVAHHVRHWADDGPTDLENLATTCGSHHTLGHREGWTYRWYDEIGWVVVDPSGVEHPRARPPDRPAVLAADPAPLGLLPAGSPP
jgi:hypothetical protein